MSDKQEKAVQQVDAVTETPSAEKPVKAKKDKPAKAKEKKPNVFVRGWKRITRYCREMKSELKKVVWPSRKQVIRNTIVVLLVVLVVGVLIWIFDWLAAAVVKALVDLVN